MNNNYTKINKYEDIENTNYSDYQNKTNIQQNNKKTLCLIPKYIPCKTPHEIKEFTNNCYNIYFNTKKFKSFNDFIRFLRPDKFVSKTERDSNYATQGCCSYGPYTLTTSYDTGWHLDGQKEKKKSILNIVDNEGRKKTLYLNHKGHVGGITYYEKENLIYIPGENKEKTGKTIKTIDIYDINDIAILNNYETIIPKKQYILNKENDKIETASYLTIHENTLYTGVWKKNKKGRITKYTLDSFGNPQYQTTLTPPINNIQGMCIYEVNGKEYFIFSGSYGRNNKSELAISVLDKNNNLQKIGNYKIPCMAEQISIDENGDLMISFESDCIQYGDGVDGKGNANVQIGNVCFLDIQKIIEECKNKDYAKKS